MTSTAGSGPIMIDYLEHYLGSYGQFVREQRLGGATPLTMLEILQPAGDFSDPPVRDLAIIRLMTPVRGRIDLGAGRRAAAEVGTVWVVPAACATAITVDAPHMLRTFSVPGDLAAAVFDDCLDGAAPDLARLQDAGTQDPLLRRVLDRLWEAGASAGSADRLFCDSAVLMVLSEFARQASGGSAPRKGGLSPWQVRRVADWIETALDRPISLAELSAAAGLSPFHFARAFKATTGMTPLHYVGQRRVARAQLLLKRSDLAVVEVASACGFSSQSSFATAFKRNTGLTPATWRSASRSATAAPDRRQNRAEPEPPTI